MLFLINRRKNLRDAITQTTGSPRRSLNTAYNPPANVEQRLAAAMREPEFPLPPPPCIAECHSSKHYVDPNLPVQGAGLGAVPKRTSSLSAQSLNIGVKRPAPATPQTSARSAARLLNQQPLEDIADDVFLRTRSFKGPSTFATPGSQVNENYYEMHQAGSQSSVLPLLSNMVDKNGFQTAEFQFEK